MTLRTDGIYAPSRATGHPKTSLKLEGSRVVRTLKDRWIVHSDDEAETGLQIYNQLPAQMKVGFDYGDGFTIRGCDIERNSDARNQWFINLSGDDQLTDKEKEDKDKPPDQRRAEWSWDFETQEYALIKDVDDRPVVNSAEDPYEVTYPSAVPVLTVTKQQASFDPDTILNFVNHVNDASFWGAPKGAALMAGIREQKGETFNGVEYRAVTYVIKFAIPDIEGVREGWKLKLIDHGPNEFRAGEKVAIRDQDGNKITANLSPNGEAKDPGDDPNTLTFKQFKEADFGSLGINWPL